MGAFIHYGAFCAGYFFRRSFLFSVFLWLVLRMPSATPQEAESILFQLQVTNFLSFTADRSQLTLGFDDFSADSTSRTETITYKITGNHLMRDKNIVTAKLSSEFNGVALEAQFGAFQMTEGNAILVAAVPGFVRISQKEVSLANRQILRGQGNLISGFFQIFYRARALRDLEAKQESKNLSLTVSDI